MKKKRPNLNRCIAKRGHSPGQGESSQCLLCEIFSSLELVKASSHILSYLATSSCRRRLATISGGNKRPRANSLTSAGGGVTERRAASVDQTSRGEV